MDLASILDSTPEPHVAPLQFNLNYDTLSGDYNLAVPLSDFQRELMDQIVSLHYSDILKFFETKGDYDQDQQVINKPQDQLILDSLNTLLLNTQLVALHPYLLITHYMPKNLSTKDTPRIVTEASGKFKTLLDIMTILSDVYFKGNRSGKFNLAIISRNGKCMDLIESVLLGFKCKIQKYAGAKLKDFSKSRDATFTVHLFPSDDQSIDKLQVDEAVSFNLVIAFDITCDTELSLFQQIRRQNRPYPAPILRLVSINSIEHIALYFRKLTSARNFSQYLKPVTAALVVMRDRAGVLPSELRPIYSQRLLYLKEWLIALGKSQGTQPRWPLPELSSIAEYSPSDVERSLLTEVKFNFGNEEHRHKKLKADTESHMEKLCNRDDFYETQRLERDYLSNPLKVRNIGQVTGIAHSSGGNVDTTLTHQVIRSLILQYERYWSLSEELASHDRFTKTKIETLECAKTTMSKMLVDLDHVEARIDVGKKKVASRSLLLDECLKGCEESREKIDGVVSGGATDSEIDTAIRKNAAVHRLKQEIQAIKTKTSNFASENEYMTQEVERANASVTDSEQELSRLTKVHTELKEKVAVMLSDIATNVVEKQCDVLKRDLERLAQKKDIAEKMVEHNLALLNQRSRHHRAL